MAASIRDLVSYRLAVLVNLNDRSGHAHLKETFGVTLSAWRVLGNIAHHKRASFADIATEMLIDKGQLSRTVSSLVARGFVTAVSTPNDRRGVTLSLTAAGTRFHARVLAFAADRNAALLSCLNQQEQRALDVTLAKLAAFIEVEHAALSFGNAQDAETMARKAAIQRRSA